MPILLLLIGKTLFYPIRPLPSKNHKTPMHECGAGIGLLNQSKTQPAIKQLEEATVLGPNPMAFFYLATAYAQANQKEKCVASLNQALTNGFSALSLF
jgi:thioredoxin-like negative regulator of GroEL